MRRKICLLLLLSFISCIGANALSWHVCVGSFTIEDNARAFSRGLDSSGFESTVYKTYTKGRNYYRVLINKGFANRKDARAYRDSLIDDPTLKQLGVKGIWICLSDIGEGIALKENSDMPISEDLPYTVVIRVYKDEDGALQSERRLKAKSIDVYIAKTLDKDEAITFSLNAGAFKTSEEAEELVAKLDDMGIKGSVTAKYDDIVPQTKEYDQMLKETTIVTTEGRLDVPNTFSPYVETIVRSFPINADFSLERLYIIDLDNIGERKGETALEEINKLVGDATGDGKVHAISLAYYKDDLYDKNVQIVVASGDKGTFTPPSGENTIELELSGEKDTFTLSKAPRAKETTPRDTPTTPGTMGNDKGAMPPLSMPSDSDTTNSGDWTLTGATKDKSIFVTLKASDFNDEQFGAFLGNLKNDSGLLVYPQVRRTLLVLPNKDDNIERTFLYFTLERVDPAYEEQKGGATWAKNVVGHWESEGVFLEDNKELSIAFFDLDYDYNARRTHDMFMDEHSSTVESDSNHAVEVCGIRGWFVRTMFATGGEVSFATKTYIVAVDARDSALNEDNLLAVSSALKIWDTN